MIKNRKEKISLIVLLIVLIPIGLATKLYIGPFANWVINSSGGIFYVIFWCLFFRLFAENIKPLYLCSIIFCLTCIIEFSQLWHPSFLEILRSYFIGRAILGTSFSISDFPYYLIGGIIGWIWIKALNIYHN